jgi:thymidylate synthase
VFARPINPAFALAEVIWILAGSNDLSFLQFWNPRMRHFSDDGIKLCGAYGDRLGSQPKLDPAAVQRLRHRLVSDAPPDQLKMAYKALMQSPNSRQVVLQIWNAKLDMPDPTPKSKDVPCNLVSHLTLRDKKLEWLQVMRSNDLFWGFPYNIIQFTTLQEIVAGWLGVEVGSYTHFSDSLHVYERHWKDLEAIGFGSDDIPVNQSDLRIASYDSWEEVFGKFVRNVLDLMEHSSPEDLISAYGELPDLPKPYQEWMAVLTAEALRKRGHLKEAQRMANNAGPFWNTTWRKWLAVTLEETKAEVDLSTPVL